MTTPELRLVTIPFSHYCEKARWALDRAGFAYVEEPHLPMLSWIAAWRAGGRRFVPVLVTPDGAITDSTDILRWCDRHGRGAPLFPPGALGDEVAALEDDLDRRLGPHARRLAYAAVLPHRELAAALFAQVPAWQAKLVGATFPVVRQLMTRLLDLSPAALARSRQVVDAEFAAVAERLGDGRRYLTGDAFTAADLTFATLAIPVLAPDENAHRLPPRAQWPAEFAAMVDAYRDTPAGRFALRVYADDRADVVAAN